jgi:hemoglobin
MKDICSEEDIKFMVDTFYDKVNQDDLLSAVFNDFAEVDWKHHLPRMYEFWNFIILGIPGYKGQPFPVHAVLPVNKNHFERWIEIFTQNIDEHFSGTNADIAKQKAANIAGIFQHKMGLMGNE